MKKKDILITGVAGFIGSKVAKKFLEAGYFVYGVDDLSSGYKNNIPKGIKFIKKDLAKIIYQIFTKKYWASFTLLDNLQEKVITNQ